MRNKEFTKFISDFRKEQDKLIKSKGFDYTIAGSDRLFNFKFVADLIGITPRQVAAVYWLKHVLAILTYVRYGKLESEGIDGRFIDEANYNLLMKAVCHDTRGKKHHVHRKASKKVSRKRLSKLSSRGV